jgi:nucleotide-binding universal stress UspA family protein
MVPLEGSPLGECSLPYAVEIANAFGSRITLARAVPPAVEAYPLMVPQVYFTDLDKELVASAQAYLERISSSYEVPSDIAVLKGPRADALITYEEQNGVDLVVMATHGRAGVQRALLGSTADRMLNGPAPVLLIRPSE